MWPISGQQPHPAPLLLSFRQRCRHTNLTAWRDAVHAEAEAVSQTCVLASGS